MKSVERTSIHPFRDSNHFHYAQPVHKNRDSDEEFIKEYLDSLGKDLQSIQDVNAGSTKPKTSPKPIVRRAQSCRENFDLLSTWGDAQPVTFCRTRSKKETSRKVVPFRRIESMANMDRFISDEVNPIETSQETVVTSTAMKSKTSETWGHDLLNTPSLKAFRSTTFEETPRTKLSISPVKVDSQCNFANQLLAALDNTPTTDLELKQQSSIPFDPVDCSQKENQSDSPVELTDIHRSESERTPSSTNYSANDNNWSMPVIIKDFKDFLSSHVFTRSSSQNLSSDDSPTKTPKELKSNFSEEDEVASTNSSESTGVAKKSRKLSYADIFKKSCSRK